MCRGRDGRGRWHPCVVDVGAGRRPGTAILTAVERHVPPPIPSRGPRNPIPHVLSDNRRDRLERHRQNISSQSDMPLRWPPTVRLNGSDLGSAGDPAQRPARRQGGEEAGAAARGLALLDQVAGQAAHASRGDRAGIRHHERPAHPDRQRHVGVGPDVAQGRDDRAEELPARRGRAGPGRRPPRPPSAAWLTTARSRGGPGQAAEPVDRGVGVGHRGRLGGRDDHHLRRPPRPASRSPGRGPSRRRPAGSRPPPPARPARRPAASGASPRTSTSVRIACAPGTIRMPPGPSTIASASGPLAGEHVAQVARRRQAAEQVDVRQAEVGVDQDDPLAASPSAIARFSARFDVPTPPLPLVRTSDRALAGAAAVLAAGGGSASGRRPRSRLDQLSQSVGLVGHISLEDRQRERYSDDRCRVRYRDHAHDRSDGSYGLNQSSA